jgi:hypothetical protein
MQQPSPAMPVLLKQGYMERKTTFRGWKREYFRLLQVTLFPDNMIMEYFQSRLNSLALQDTIFSFASHNSKIPLHEVDLVTIRIMTPLLRFPFCVEKR